MHLLKALRNATERIEHDISDSDLFNHRGDKGEFRERVIERFLRPFLRHCYGLGSGEIFSADGASSFQQDVVIYDSIFSNVLFRDHANSLFPCESVYGTIEIKSNLTSDEVEKGIANIQSVKVLIENNQICWIYSLIAG